MDSKLKQKWLAFMQKHGLSAYEKIDQFLTDMEKIYKRKKIKEFQSQGASYPAAIVKARQSWVAHVGAELENIIREIVEPVAHKYGAKVVRDKDIQKAKLNEEYDIVRRNLLVHFEKYSYLPDADLIIYKYVKRKANIIAILSVKNSFRERYTETPYWKLKLSQNPTTRTIKVFMVTTDRDSEISSAKAPSKARVILEYELDGVYITKGKTEIDSSKKVGNLSNLLEDLIHLLKKA